MLVNYSPLKVGRGVHGAGGAEATGRIDLGARPRAGNRRADRRGALRSVGSDAFPQYFHLLTTWLLDASGKAPIGDEHPPCTQHPHANPAGPSHPGDVPSRAFCTSEESAAFAGQMGVGMIFAEFIARADGGPAVAAYRRGLPQARPRSAPNPGPEIALIAYAAETAEQAWREDALRRAANDLDAVGPPAAVPRPGQRRGLPGRTSPERRSWPRWEGALDRRRRRRRSTPGWPRQRPVRPTPRRGLRH